MAWWIERKTPIPCAVKSGRSRWTEFLILLIQVTIVSSALMNLQAGWNEMILIARIGLGGFLADATTHLITLSTPIGSDITFASWVAPSRGVVGTIPGVLLVASYSRVIGGREKKLPTEVCFDLFDFNMTWLGLRLYAESLPSVILPIRSTIYMQCLCIVPPKKNYHSFAYSRDGART